MQGRVAKKKGNWYLVLEQRDSKGKRKLKWISPRKELGLSKPATKKQAEELLIKKLREMQEGTYFEPSKATVGEYMKEWLRLYCKPSLKENTYLLYEGMVRNHINPLIGTVPLNHLRPGHIQSLLAEKNKELAASTVNKIHAIIKQALEHAVDWEFVPRNVARKVTPPSAKSGPAEAWTAAEAKRFLLAVKDDRLYPLYLLALTTGMRRGELLGLRWIDVDLNERKLTIKQTLVNSPTGGRIEEPKTAGSARTIIISEKMVTVLKEHQDRQQNELNLLNNEGLDNGLVFTNTKGKPYNPSNVRRGFARTIKKIGLRHIPFHGLRHTYASILIDRRADAKAVSGRLGHTDIKMTLGTYTHTTSEMDERLAGLTDDLMIEK